jgi:putative nucleotidyltransferase with HDIG domain
MVDTFFDKVKDLPVMPEVVTRIMNLTEGGADISFKELEGIIKIDPALTAKILKIANSALYARQREITSLQMAITLLGFTNIRNLIFLLTASAAFPRMSRSPFHAAFWRHSILAAFLSRRMTIRCAGGAGAEEAFIAGLLHDIGQAVLFNSAPDTYARVLETHRLESTSLEIIEGQVFGADHRQVGGALLRKWNFPELYTDVAEEHESLHVTSAHKSTVILVSVACMVSELVAESPLSPQKMELLSELIAYTCLAGSTPEELARSYREEMSTDPLYAEYQRLFLPA